MAIIKKSLEDARVKKIDAAVEVTELFADPIAPFDVALITIDGKHGWRVNSAGGKAYLVLEGSGQVFVGDESVDVGPMDIVYIPQGARHGLKGRFRFLDIASPPFSPETDRLVDDML
jgi:mannose-6-phosphate isomerase-like protein (cupin superfamily)